MGKLGPRLDSRKKAKKWPKGQSSSSNPETTKHRDEATRMFFKDSTEKPGITKEDLQKHDTIQGIQPQFEKLDLDEDHWETSSENTVDTFATNYSNCSNVSFNRFLNHFQSNSTLHKEMLAVLSAVTEVIKQNGGNESSTEYFAALMSTLEAIETTTSIAATLSLLGMGLKSVPRNVLNVQFGAASRTFLDILGKYASSEDFLILRHCIHCLCLLLRAQESAAWTNSSTKQVLEAVLSFVTHSKPKVRKSAQHGLCALLRESDLMKTNNPPPYHPASSYIAKYCIDQMQLGSEPGGITSVLHILTLLKDIFHYLPKTYVKAISENLLKLMTLNNILITSCCLQTFYDLFVSRPSESILPGQRNAQIITALYDYQPPANDAQPTLAWLTVMQEAHLNLAQTSLNFCAAILPKFFDKCMELWLSDKSEVICSTSYTIKVIIEDCLGKMCENEESLIKYKITTDQITCMIHKALNYQYLGAWYHIFHLIALFIQTTGKSKSSKLIDLVRTLSNLRDSYNFASKNDVEYPIGAAIRVLGPELVMNLIPLNASDNTINLKRTWLLPLLKDCAVSGSLNFFMERLLPLATYCEKKASETTGGKTYEFLASQIWAVLPGICNNASDVKDNFHNIARFLGMSFTEKKDLRLIIMSALRRLIIRAVEDNRKEDIFELAKFAKNYLPLFLNLYTTTPSGTDEEGQRLAALDTIKVYLKITNTVLVNELFDRALCRLNEPNIDVFYKESVQDIIGALIEYTDFERLKTFCDQHVLTLNRSSAPKDQKKSYRVLETVCESEQETCKLFIRQHRQEIEKMLISLSVCVTKPSRAARLKCLIYLVKTHPQLEKTKILETVVPEAIIYLRDINSKCRANAYQLLNIIAELLLEKPEHLKNYIRMLTVGLSGSQKYCTSSLLALASVTCHYNGSLGVDTIKEVLECACNAAASPARELTEAALSFIKVYITVMPSPIVASTLTKIIDGLCSMTNDCHRHFRQKIRDILVKLLRKYGAETISVMIPASDVMLRKRLKNINKIEKVKKKNKGLRKSREQEVDEDSEFNTKRRPNSLEEILADSEFEDSENETPRKNKKRTSRKEAWIQENGEIVDLMDPTAARNISTTRPSIFNPKLAAKKSKDRGFKTAPDGRLIIMETNEKDEAETKETKRSPILHSDSEDDCDDDIHSIAASYAVGSKRKSDDNSDNSQKYQAGGSGIHRPFKKGKTESTPGAEYKAPKAGGDVKKKGKPDPYAYIPLLKSGLSKRKKRKLANKLQSIIKAATKNAQD